LCEDRTTIGRLPNGSSTLPAHCALQKNLPQFQFSNAEKIQSFVEVDLLIASLLKVLAIV
jgi:hypothetical protein